MDSSVPYASIFTLLAKQQIRYLVVGGFAVNFYQVQRATVDLDLIVQLEELNLNKFLAVMDSIGYRPRLPVLPRDFANPDIRKLWIREKGMMVFSFFHPESDFEAVDVFVDEPKPFEELYSRRTTLKAFGVDISVIGLEDLKDMKRDAGRDKDLFDLSQLEKKR